MEKFPVTKQLRPSETVTAPGAVEGKYSRPVAIAHPGLILHITASHCTPSLVFSSEPPLQKIILICEAVHV